MSSRLQSRIGSIVFWVAVAAVVAVQLWVVIPGVFSMRLWEDEAFNLTVPINLLNGLGYTSDGTLSGSQLSTFDPRISTGPVVLLPVTVVLALGVDPVIGGRLVILCFYIALLAGLWVLGRRIGGAIAGRWAGLAAVCVPLGWNTWASGSPIQSPVDILGEVPSAALLVWAIVVLKKRPWLAGLLVGLAMQAKLIAALGAPAIAVGVFITSTGGFWARAKRVVVCGAVAVMPNALTELWKLITFGPAGYATNLREFYWFFKSGGQNISPVPPGDKIEALVTNWFSPTWLTLLAIIAFVVVTVIVLVRQLRKRRASPVSQTVVDVAKRDDAALAVVALVGLLTWAGWWALSRGTPVWPRHPSPGIYTFVPLLAAVLVTGIARLWRAKSHNLVLRVVAAASSAVLFCALALQLVGHAAVADDSRFGEDLADQRKAASAVAELGEDQLVSSWGPEVSIVVLSGAHAGLSDVPALYGTPQVWRNYDASAAGQAEFAARLEKNCEDVPVREGAYAVCVPNS